MDQTTKSRAAVAMMAFMAANALLFCAGIVIAVMSAVPELAPWIAVAIIAGLVLAAPIIRDIVRRLRSHDWPAAVNEPASLRVQYRGYQRS
jgi:DMSO reductase anchor subunit